MTKKEFVSMSLPYKLKVLIPESDKKGQAVDVNSLKFNPYKKKQYENNRRSCN